MKALRWRGSGPPASSVPADYPPPDRPVPLYVDGPLPVGAERRYGLAVGCGGGVWIDGQTWELTGPLPEPLRNAWPHVAPVSTDGPQVEIFGRITRTAAGTIAFSIEGLGTVAMLRPITTAPALHGA